FLGFYFLGGALAVCAQWASSPESPTPVIGASGAVWAILGAYAVTYPWARVKSLVFVIVPLLLEVPALIVIAAYFAIDLFTVLVGVENGQQAQAVAHWAHLGGCAAGVTLMPLLAIGVSPPESDWRGETDSLLVTGERVE
ncbi:MAG: rhomboid family intramembrane serine protease, partial [Planctomycetota bacterium]